MLEITTIILLFLSGCLGGFFAGLLGIGGGLIFIPMLTYYCHAIGVSDADITKTFLANSFFAIVFSGITSSVKQYSMGQFFPKQVLITSASAIAFSLFVSWLIGIGDWYNKERFTVLFILVLIMLNIRLFIHRKQDTSTSILTFSNDKFIITGLIAGVFAALSGLGGGFIMVMLFVQWLKIDIKQASAVSTGTIPFIATPLVIYYMIHQPTNFPEGVFHVGYILVYAMLPVIAGVIACSSLGVYVASKMSQVKIKLIFIFFSILIIAKMVFEII